jgi:vitamin B12 transporter
MSWPLLVFFSTLALGSEQLLPIEVRNTKDIEYFTSSTSTKITETELDRSLPLISDPLQGLPGVVSSQNGGPGGRVSYFIRGTEARHVSVTLDGLKLNDVSNTDRQFNAAYFLAPSLKGIILHRGPSPVLYGADALGGVIELKSRKGDYAPETRLSLSGGSFGTYSSSLSSDWKKKHHQGTLTWSSFHSDGLSRINKKRFNATEKDATDVTQLTSSSLHRWTKGMQTDFLFSYLRGKSEQDSFGDDNSFDESLNDQYMAQQKSSLHLNNLSALSLRTGFSRHQRKNQDVFSGVESYNGNLLQHELLLEKRSGFLTSLGGVATENEAVRARNLDRSVDLHSLFFQSAYKRDTLKLHAGFRAEKHTRYGGFQTGAAGFSWEDFSFQYSQGFKAPSLYQLYGPDLFGGPVGNLHLRPERSHSIEASYSYQQGDLEMRSTLFQNRLSDLISFIQGKGYLNQKFFIAEGVELEGKYRHENFETKASFTHQQFRKEESVVLLRPYNQATGSFSYFPKDDWELNISARWLSSRKDSSSGTVKLNGYEVADLGIRKIWVKDEASLQFKNIFNREYEDVFGFSTISRSVFASYGHRF